MMRKVLAVFGAAMLLVFVAAGVGLGVLVYKGLALDAECKAYVDGAVPAIVRSWDRQELIERSTPELIATIKPGELNAFWGRLSQFGALIEYQGASGGSLQTFNPQQGSIISARYTAKARFENGEATFRLLLMKRDGRWLIQGFHVDSLPGVRAAQRT